VSERIDMSICFAPEMINHLVYYWKREIRRVVGSENVLKSAQHISPLVNLIRR